MARPRKVPELKNFDACQEAMHRLRIATIEQDRLVTSREKGLAFVTERFAEEINAQVNQIADLQLQLQNYYMAHLAEIEKDGKKSVQLTHGLMGRRLGNPTLKLLNKSWTWQSVLVKLRTVFGDRFIRMAEPEPDKPGIKAAGLTPDELKAVGLKIDQAEDFYAEPEKSAPTEAV